MMQLTDEERAALGATRAIIDKLLGGNERESGLAELPPEEPKWMKLIDYARSRSIGRRSLDRYIAAGMPTKGEGKMRRVVVDEADSWLERHHG